MVKSLKLKCIIVRLEVDNDYLMLTSHTSELLVQAWFELRKVLGGTVPPDHDPDPSSDFSAPPCLFLQEMPSDKLSDFFDQL